MTTTVPTTPRPKQQECDLRGCVANHTNDQATGYICRTAATRLELASGRWLEVRRSQFVVEDDAQGFLTGEQHVDLEWPDTEGEVLTEDAARQLIAVLQFNVDQLAAYRHEIYRFNAERQA
jgi:hypothetical protein